MEEDLASAWCKRWKSMKYFCEAEGTWYSCSLSMNKVQIPSPSPGVTFGREFKLQGSSTLDIVFIVN